MIVVHHLNNSRSQRILWLLEELELAFEIRYYQRDPATQLAPLELRAVHPLGKSPVVTDGGDVLAESGAIIDTLLERYGRGRLEPAVGTPERVPYRYWLHFAEGSALPALTMKLVFDKLRIAPMPFFVRPVAGAIANKVEDMLILPNLRRQLDLVEATLAAAPWFAGLDFSAADIQMSFPLEVVHSQPELGKRRPHSAAFVERIRDRPAYQRAREKGGPFTPAW